MLTRLVSSGFFIMIHGSTFLALIALTAVTLPCS